jgi:Virulence factor BrkB
MSHLSQLPSSNSESNFCNGLMPLFLTRPSWTVPEVLKGIGKQGLESTYGVAASIVIVLIWVYYSAQIVLLGAELTNVYPSNDY